MTNTPRTPDGAVPEVLVVGAGPVGLTMAHELARNGVPVRLIEARAEPADTSRAIAVHARTLEVYDQMGLADEMIDQGIVITGFTPYRNGKCLARLDADYSTIPTRYPHSLAIDQVRTEMVLRNGASRLGVEVEWSTSLERLEQLDDRVLAWLRSPDGTTELVEVPWLVGCDGGHSRVRKALDLPLLGDSNETWLITDTTVATELPRDSIYWIKSGRHSLMMVPLPDDRWRLLDTSEPTWDGDAAALADRFATKLSAGVGHRVVVDEPSWVSVFTAQQRMVPAMSSGRCFVAGDAAHVHSPASGQGMNTGIQEAVNLAWKLAMVHDGHAGRELLDSYGQERVPVGQELLESTTTATRLVALKEAVGDLALPVVFALVRSVGPLRRKIERAILSKMSGLKLSYGASGLTVDAGTEGFGPRPGERLAQVDVEAGATGAWQEVLGELRDPRWLLLRAPTAPSGPARSESWLSTRTLAGASTAAAPELADPDGALTVALGLDGPAWILVRPDGYVAARGDASGPGPEAVLERLLRLDPVPTGRRGPLATIGAGNPPTTGSYEGSSK